MFQSVSGRTCVRAAARKILAVLSRSAIADLSKIVSTAALPILSAVLVSVSAQASGSKAPLDQPTPFQKDCRQTALEEGPRPVVFAFDGLNAYDAKDYRGLKSGARSPAEDGTHSEGHVLWGMIAHGILEVPGDKEWYYFGENMVDGDNLTDPYRCAYEWATARYAVQQSDGTVVTRRNQIVFLGFSYGGHAASQLSNQFNEAGLDVDLIITADPRVKMWVGSLEKKPSTHFWANFYQTNTPFLNGYQVPGASLETNLSNLGYGHNQMPRTPEVDGYVKERFAQLYSEHP